MKSGIKGLVLAVGIGIFCASGLWAQAPAQESEFIPGDDRIIEKDILKRIQEELGQDIAREKPRAKEEKKEKDSGARTPALDLGLRGLVLNLKEGKQITGKAVISQHTLYIRPENSVQEVALPVEEIRRVEFVEWKALRLRVLSPGEKTAAEPSTRAAGENAEAPDATPNDGETEGTGTAVTANTTAALRVYFLPTRCRVTRQDESVVEGRCNSMDWLQFNLTDQAARGFRTYFTEERPLPEGGAKELEKTLATLKAETPVDTVVSVELGETTRPVSSLETNDRAN